MGTQNLKAFTHNKGSFLLVKVEWQNKDFVSIL